MFVEEKAESSDKIVPESFAFDDIVQEAVLEQKLRTLEALGELFLDSLFDDQSEYNSGVTRATITDESITISVGMLTVFPDNVCG